MTATPLQIALQEYAYWRKASLSPPHGTDPEAFTDLEFFESVTMGGIGAAANISSRLAGHEFEGIDYEALSPDQITKLLVEIKLAPRLARVLGVLVALEHEPPSLREPVLAEAHGLLEELKRAGWNEGCCNQQNAGEPAGKEK